MGDLLPQFPVLFKGGIIMTQSNKIPCVPLPKAKKLKITLPFGGELQSIADTSKGPPTDCALVHSLMLQLTPTLSGMTCFFKMLKVIKVLSEIKQPGDILEVAKAAKELSKCFLVFESIPAMIADILRLIIAYLRCIIQAIKSILDFQVGIDLNAAQGNPVLLASLDCANNNAQISLDQLMEQIAVIEPLLAVVEPIAGLVGISLEFPSLAKVSGADDLPKTLENLNNTLEQLQQAVDAIPV
jgi:hypothetical protein